MITLWFGLFAEPKTYIAFLQVAVEAYKDFFDWEKINGKSNTGFSPSSHIINNLCIHE